MRTTVQLTACLILIAPMTLAQEKPPAKPAEPPAVQVIPAVPLLPAMRVAGMAMRHKPLPFELGDLVLAKLDVSAKGAQLVALVEQTRTEERDVPVTTVRQEVRTRKVTVGEGDQKKEVDQTYTVSIPVTENRTVTVPVSVGKKPTTYAMDQIKIYKLDGTVVQLGEAKQLLEKMQPVFLIQQPQTEFKPLEELYLRALNPNCLVVILQ